jgi:hypothetical protein
MKGPGLDAPRQLPVQHLHVELEQQHIAVLDDVLLAFHAVEALVARRAFSSLDRCLAAAGRFLLVPGDEEEWIPIPAVPKTVSYP